VKRWLVIETTATSDPEFADPTKTRGYGDGAKLDIQRRPTTFLPLRPRHTACPRRDVRHDQLRRALMNPAAGCARAGKRLESTLRSSRSRPRRHQPAALR